MRWTTPLQTMRTPKRHAPPYRRLPAGQGARVAAHIAPKRARAAWRPRPYWTPLFAQEDNILGSIFAELGVEATAGIAATPTANVSAAAPSTTAQPAAAAAAAGGGDDGGGGGGDDLDAELQKRLDNLRRT